jgi:nicotinamide riboside transporter PnuC
MKGSRPPVAGAIGFLVFTTAIYVFDRMTHQDGIALVAFVGVCAAVIGWFLWSRRYQ